MTRTKILSRKIQQHIPCCFLQTLLIQSYSQFPLFTRPYAVVNSLQLESRWVLLAVHTGGSCRKQTGLMLSRVTVRGTSPWRIYLMVLEMVVVVWPSLPDSGSPFSRSCSLLGFAFLPGGGELRRIPVRRFWRFCLLTSTVERPVMRREARRIDCRTSHWRFFASHQSVADPTANTSVTILLNSNCRITYCHQ
jgi:hypothetical protein